MMLAYRKMEILQGMASNLCKEWSSRQKRNLSQLAFLKLVANHPPNVTSEVAQISSLSLVGRLLLTLMPELSNKEENWNKLEDWTILCVASLVSENLQAGRATPLFETNVQL